MEKRRSVRRFGSRKYKKPFAEKCKDFMRNFIAFMFSNVGIIGLVVGYTVVGAIMFQYIEGRSEQEMTSNMVAVRNNTADKLWRMLSEDNVFDEVRWRNSVTTELENYTRIVTSAIKDGFDGTTKTDYNQKWSFPGAFLYSLTVITTIGYGNVSPKTVRGKVITIVYAIIGMPLFLLYLSNIGDILARCFKWLYSKCCLCQWCPNVAKRREERKKSREAGASLQDLSGQGQGSQLWQMRHLNPYVEGDVEEPFPSGASEKGGDEDDDDDDDAVTNASFEEYDPQTVTVPVTICLAIMVGYICGGALLFAKYEDWNFLDSSYFCFISLSTIGFGDIVPGDNTYGKGFNMSFVFCSMYLMLGMALIAMCFNLMQEEVIHKIRKSIRTVKRIFR